MRRIIMIAIAIIVSMGAWAQEEELSKRELRKMKREARKAEKQARTELTADLTEQMVEKQHFVLEADYLSDKYGARIPVQSNINFILVDSTQGVVQFGSASSLGYNGVGGVTVEGRVRNYEERAMGRKDNSWSIMYSFASSTWGNLDINLIVGSDGTADATIRGNWGSTLNYHGRLVPIASSSVYEGTALH